MATDFEFHELAWRYLEQLLAHDLKSIDAAEQLARACDSLLAAWVEERRQEALILGRHCLTLDAGKVTTRHAVLVINPSDRGLLERARFWIEAQIPIPFEVPEPRKDEPDA